jgi:membrane-associated phospholipid phosphatase
MNDRDLETTAWTWVPPLLFAAALAALWAAGTNEAWFYRLNGWSDATGPQVWAGITIFGDALVLLALALPILWYRPQWAWALLVAALVTTIATHTLKPWLDLPRPAAVLGADAITIIGPELRAKAMPSGHAAAALTLVGALVPVVRSRSVRLLLLLLGVLVALSRVVVGAHWPMDVMAGAVIGWMSGMISMRLMGDRSWMNHRVAVGILTLAFTGCAAALLVTHTGYPGTYGIQVAVGLVCIGFAGQIVRGLRNPKPESMTDA